MLWQESSRNFDRVESRSAADIIGDEGGESPEIQNVKKQVLREDISRAISMPESPVLAAAIDEQLDIERELYEDVLVLVASMLHKDPQRRAHLPTVVNDDFVSQRGRYPLTLRRDSVVTISQSDISSAVTEVTRLSTVIKIKTKLRKYVCAAVYAFGVGGMEGTTFVSRAPLCTL